MRIHFQALTVGLLIAAAVPTAVSAQTKDEQNRKAFGSRIGDREQDANNAGLSGDRRTSRRIDSRIDSRLQTRIDRFTEPQADAKNAYTPKVDDGTKTQP